MMGGLGWLRDPCEALPLAPGYFRQDEAGGAGRGLALLGPGFLLGARVTQPGRW